MAHPWIDENRPVYPGTVKEGYLVKSPPLDRKGMKQWRQRWCVFTSTGNEPPCLLYFTDRQAVLTGRMPLNRVPLQTCSKVERALSHSSRPNVFAVHLPERVYYFSAVSQGPEPVPTGPTKPSEEMMAWVDALSAHLKLTPEDTHPSPPPSPPRSRTLPRVSRSVSPARDRASSLKQFTNSKRDQPLPPLPFSTSPVPTQLQYSIMNDDSPPPPLPERPDDLKYAHLSPPPL